MEIFIHLRKSIGMVSPWILGAWNKCEVRQSSVANHHLSPLLAEAKATRVLLKQQL